MSSSSLQPLQSALDAILGRLAALESQAGIKAPSPSTSTSIGSAAAAVVVEGEFYTTTMITMHDI